MNAQNADIGPNGGDARCLYATRCALCAWRSQQATLGHRGNRITDYEVIEYPNLDQ